MQGGAQPRARHGLQVVAEPVHGLCPPLHVLLRPRVRAPRRPALRRPLRHLDQGQDQRRRRAAHAARAAVVGATSSSRSEPRPTRTSRPRAATGSRGPASRSLGEAANPLTIITRGPMIVRDVDVLAEAARHASVSVTFSIPTLDEDVWRKTEPSTAHPRQRLRALKQLVDAGIKAGVGMAPILPGISDRPEQLAEVVRAAREAGATGVWANLLFLRPGTREHFLEHLAEDWPELVPLYEELYAGQGLPPRRADEARPRAGRRPRATLRDRRPAHQADPARASPRAALPRALGEVDRPPTIPRPPWKRLRTSPRPSARSPA